MTELVKACFAEVSDPRVVGRCSHLLSDILMIGLCTYISGGTDYQDMYLFAKNRSSELSALLVLPNGIPSVDTYERVFKRIVPEELESCLLQYGSSLLSCLSEKQIIIDGKKQRGVSPTTRGNRGLYLLNVWVSENSFCLYQQKVQDKSNEITAIPDALDAIDVTGATVSIDAMGTQREVADLIVDKGGHYFLAVKDNQKQLYEDIECAFKMHSGHDVIETLEKDHGRIEKRTCSILPAKEYLMEETLSKWAHISTIIKQVSTREIKGISTQDIRYYISDEDETNAAYYQSLARGHWSIENQLHWVLDVVFKEDACRAREGYASQNLSVLRKIALHIITNYKDKLSISKRRYQAALDVEYLKRLLSI